ncbi:NmrA family NAD(P)-binding protein [Mucilaginibacter aquatilis]|uniref:NAD(P)H-binding protein n=1 Tax=Mucilaginibacter aquatilis TaxID=1517760 RepID=A0A6I4ICI3_9SPHI|nr:NmrA family NAD(P)-binding protein [Mucilaginibacter aquatilis]MVN91286.1 NAD(P)H-binding protein [Mucilaginibacter aquatilis]
MKKTIVVVGATGNLGELICHELINKGAFVKALVRVESQSEKIEKLNASGVDVIIVNYDDSSQLSAACEGADCVISALAGLRDVIVTAQTHLLNAAVQAGVPRFIPSDFCTDYTQLPKGANRNFDLRKEFRSILDDTYINATSIFNGAFSYVLKYGIPVFDTKSKTVTCPNSKENWKIDFTTVADTAKFTAAAALDDLTPRDLRIASFQLSPLDFTLLGEQLCGSPFMLQHQGTMEQFSENIDRLRAADTDGETQLYPQWQQMQYLYSMFSAQNTSLDNDRYPEIIWTSAYDTLGK